jgi:hypothetical protein
MGSKAHTSLRGSVLLKPDAGSMIIPWPGVMAIRRPPPYVM